MSSTGEEKGRHRTLDQTTELALRELGNAQELVAGLLECSLFPIQIFRSDGSCLLTNRAATELFVRPIPADFNVLLVGSPAFADSMRRAFGGELTRHALHLSSGPGQVDQAPADVEVVLVPLRNESGTVSHVACCYKDLTAQQKLQSSGEALLRSEERFRSTFEQAAVGLAHVSPSGAWLLVNDRLCEILGYTRAELLARTFQDISHPADLNADLSFVDEMLLGKLKTYSMEKRYIRKDGTSVWCDLTVSLVRHASGQPNYFISVVQDISARVAANQALIKSTSALEAEIIKKRRAENSLRHSEESLAATLHSIGDGVVTTDTSGHITRINPVAQALTGWTSQEALNQPLNEVFRIVDEDTGEPTESPADRALREGVVTGQANHTLLVARDGTKRTISHSAAPIRDLSGFLRGVVLIFRDQSQNRAAERALRESETRKGAILEAALDCIVSMDAAGLITEFNPAAERTFRYSRAAVLGKPLVEILIPPSLRESHAAGFSRYLETGVGTILGKRLELSAMRADGSEFPVELTVVSINSLAQPMFTAYIRDISEQKQARDALERSEARFRHLAESGVIGVIVADIAGRIHETNQAFLDIVGYSREELTSGKIGWSDLTPPEWREQDRSAVESIRTTGVEKPREKEYRRKDGTRIPVLVCAAMLDEERCLGVVLDLSDRQEARALGERAEQAALAESIQREHAEQALRQAEEQLRQSQKLEAVGALTGSIAHDFNNLLSVILSYSTLMLNELAGSDPMRADLEQIAAAATRAAELTHQLLAFSRQQVLQPAVVNLNDAISGMARMLERVLGEDIEFVLELGSSPGAVFVDPSQVDQILMNLVVNAREAMPLGGKLTIQTTDEDFENEHDASLLDLAPGRYVVLSVVDTGTGMDRATTARIFEPFFTTKPRGKGTGLGLSTVFGIVKQSGGNVVVSSAFGQGTLFKVYLPRARASSRPSERVRRPANPVRGTETVLLVEDNEQVRTLASAILRRNGYRVLEAATGNEALAIAESQAGALDLLLTDVVMPQMSGRLLWEKLSARHPSAKVLYMSGYTDDAVIRHGVLTAGVSFIQKPITPAPLLLKVREVLDRTA